MLRSLKVGEFGYNITKKTFKDLYLIYLNINIMSNSNILTIFNDHFAEFLNDIHGVFPDDADILTAKNSLASIRKANPKLLARIWIKYVADPYRDRIIEGDINFFIEKDYANDLTKTGNSDQIMESIDRLRKPVKQMNSENRQKTMKYIQNLCKISDMIPTSTFN